MKIGSQPAVETKISPFSLIKMSLLTPVYLVVQHFFLTFLIYWLSIRDRTISEQQNFQNSVPNDQNLKYSFWWINLGLFWISNFDQDKILVLQNYSKLYLCNFRINCQYVLKIKDSCNFRDWNIANIRISTSLNHCTTFM